MQFRPSSTFSNEPLVFEARHDASWKATVTSRRRLAHFNFMQTQLSPQAIVVTTKSLVPQDSFLDLPFVKTPTKTPAKRERRASNQTALRKEIVALKNTIQTLELTMQPVVGSLREVAQRQQSPRSECPICQGRDPNCDWNDTRERERYRYEMERRMLSLTY